MWVCWPRFLCAAVPAHGPELWSGRPWPWKRSPWRDFCRCPAQQTAPSPGRSTVTHGPVRFLMNDLINNLNYQTLVKPMEPNQHWLQTCGHTMSLFLLYGAPRLWAGRPQSKSGSCRCWGWLGPDGHRQTMNECLFCLIKYKIRVHSQAHSFRHFQARDFVCCNFPHESPRTRWCNSFSSCGVNSFQLWWN